MCGNNTKNAELFVYFKPLLYLRSVFMKDAPGQRTRMTILKILIHQLGSQKSRKFHRNRNNWHTLVHVWCTIFAVFTIRAMREPL